MPLTPKIYLVKYKKFNDENLNLPMIKLKYSNGEVRIIPYVKYLGEKKINRRLKPREIVIDIYNDQKYIFVCQISPGSNRQTYLKIRCICPICGSAFYSRLNKVIGMWQGGFAPFCRGRYCRLKFDRLNGTAKEIIKDKINTFYFIEKALDIMDYNLKNNPYFKYEFSQIYGVSQECP